MSSEISKFAGAISEGIGSFVNILFRPRLKIGFVLHPFMGGSGIAGMAIAEELAKRGHEVHLIVYKQPFRNEGSARVHLIDTAGFPVFEYFPITLAAANKIVEVVERHNLDLLHVHYALPYSVASYLAKQMCLLDGKKIPVITTVHGSDIHTIGLTEQFRNITKFSLGASDGITSVSGFLSEKVENDFNVKQGVVTIPNFVDPERFSRKRLPGLRARFAKDSERILLHFSNFRKVKRVKDIVKVFRRVSKRIPSVLIMGGDGPERKSAQALAKKMKLSGKVFFVGSQKKPEDFYSIADLFLLLSEKEGCPLTILEAMACGVPVLATRAGGIPEIIRHGREGFLAGVGNVQKLSGLAVRILSDRQLWKGMSHNARKKAVKNYSAKSIIPEYEDYYYKVLISSPLRVVN